MLDYMLNAEDVAGLLKVSQAQGYKIIRTLNEQLEKAGYLTMRGRVPTKFLFEKFNIPFPETEGE